MILGFVDDLVLCPAIFLPPRYVDKLEKIFQNAPSDPTQDFSTQVYVARTFVQRLLASQLSTFLHHARLGWALVETRTVRSCGAVGCLLS